jgi:DNA-binding MarR family transcriptional regulator
MSPSAAQTPASMTRQQLLHALIDLFAFKGEYQAASSGLRPADMQLLERVGFQEGVHTLELARRCAIAPATAVAILDRLQAAGYVLRERDLTDKRIVRVSLTPAGRSLLERHAAEDRVFMDNLLAPLLPSERAQLERLLTVALSSVSFESIFTTGSTDRAAATARPS